MHENYPAAMRVWRQKGMIALIFKNYRLDLLLDKFCWKKVNKIIVVVEEQQEYLLSRAVSRTKIHVVSNTENINKFKELEIDGDIVDRYTNEFMILYIGTISIDRGLETPIRAMSAIADKLRYCKLVIVGKGKYREQLINLAAQEGVTEFVKFVDWVDFHKVPSYIMASKVCIVPQPSNPFIDNTIPHKLFQYMTLGKPVVVSDAKPLARVVNECHCGEVFTSNSAESFASAVFRIAHGKTDYGENGSNAVMEKYNWQTSSKELIRLYKQVVDESRINNKEDSLSIERS